MNSKTPNNGLEDSIDLSAILENLWSKKYNILIVTLVFAVLSVVYSLSISNIYTAEMIVEEVQDGSSNSQPSSFGGFASLAGLTSTGSSKSKAQYAQEIVATKDFFDILIKEEEFMIELIAVNGFDKNTKELLYDQSIYNIDDKSIDSKYLLSRYHEDIHNLFLSKISLTNLDSGSVLISVSHHSPIIAKKWLDNIFIELNEVVKNLKLTKAKKSFDFLKKELSMTSEIELQKVISMLITKEIQTITLSESSENFVFSIIDSSRVPERKSYPHRAQICISITLFGFLIACLYSMIRPSKVAVISYKEI